MIIDDNQPNVVNNFIKTMSPRIEKSPLRCDITAEQTPPSKRKTVFYDRFIPSQVRRAIDFTPYLIPNEKRQKKEKNIDSECSEKSHEKDTSSDFASIHEKQSEEVYKTLLKNEFCEIQTKNSMFSYKESLDNQATVFSTSPRIPYCNANQKILRSDIQEYRRISRHPMKVLDAPGLPVDINDYYLNLLDWSRSNIVAVALANKPNLLSFTTSNGMLYIYDAKQEKCIQRKQVSTGQRIGCIDWNGYILSTGCRDGVIRSYDTRSDIPLFTSSSHGHSLEVCGLKWDPSGKILASGGNDNKIFLWNINEKIPINCLTGHQGAVKALSWSPHEYGVLASGGGSADRCIKFWNTKSHQLINSYDTQSQVCNVQWSTTDKEIVSTHGFSSNAINLWSYPSMEKLISLKGHTSRVGTSPDGEKIVTGSADETLSLQDN
ncbi:hypothetical protein MXB_2584 [Myxobolus squamalis]|nr:hypothetical protein MXB_2584 [Myxobolus squamalis]